MINKIYAIQLAESIVIKETDFFLNGKVIFSERNELFLEKSKDQYIYIYNHGVVCFYNIELDEVDKIKKQLLQYTINPSTGLLREEFEIFLSNNTNYIDQDNIYITDGNTEAIRLVMLNISKSVMLNKYSLEVDNTITEIKKYMVYFEKPEKLYISGKFSSIFKIFSHTLITFSYSFIWQCLINILKCSEIFIIYFFK